MTAVGSAAGRDAVHRVLPRAFYARGTLDVACDLIGKVLLHDTPDGTTSGVIVEAEAYIGEDDPACHAAPGPTVRNQPLYGEPGYAYVYLNYGLHYLVNAVTEPQGAPAAVLLRALDGIELMLRRRSASRDAAALTGLCRGPGNLTKALGIDLRCNRSDLCASALRIEDRDVRPGPLAWSPRIGIRVGTGQWWRVFVKDHPAVSGPRAWHRDGRRSPRPPVRT